MKMEDIIRLIQKEIEGGDVGSIEEMNVLISQMLEKANNEPGVGTEGLSPLQMHHILGLLFDGGELVTLNPDIPDELAMTSKFLRICRHILGAIPEDKPLKLTATGALPRWLVREVSQGYVCSWGFPEIDNLVIMKESDCFLIHIARLICELSGVAKQGKGKEKGKWILTRKGKKLLTRPGEMLEVLFTTFVKKFAWSYLDHYPSETAGQIGFGFTLLLLHRYGDEHREVDFYVEKYLRAFPMEIEEFKGLRYTDIRKVFFRCYSHRSFAMFLQPFGFVDLISKGEKYHDDYLEEVATTPLFDAFIEVDPKVSDQYEEDELDEEEEEGAFFGEPFHKPILIEKMPNRNDPCPCGSGRKYKKCCLQ